MTKPYAIVIPAYGNFDLTERCVKSLTDENRRQTTIIDDGSPNSGEIPYERLGVYQTVRLAPNVGPHEAWNVGFYCAVGNDTEVAVFLNNDVVCRPDTVENLVRCVSAETPLVGATEWPGSVVGCGPDDDFYRAEVEPGEVHDGWYMSAFAVDAGTWVGLGGVDSRMRLVFADTDFALRVIQHGGRPVIADGALVYHGKSVTRKRLGLRKDVEQEIKDRAVFNAKWFGNPLARGHLFAPAFDVSVEEKAASWSEGER